MKGNEKVEDTKVKNRRTDNTMVPRRRTDNTMVPRRRTDNTMVPRRRTKGKAMIYNTATQKIGVDIGAPEHEQN